MKVDDRFCNHVIRHWAVCTGHLVLPGGELDRGGGEGGYQYHTDLADLNE